MSTRFAKYWTESGRGDGQGDVEKKDHHHRRPYMMGKARGKVGSVLTIKCRGEDQYRLFVSERLLDRSKPLTDTISRKKLVY